MKLALALEYRLAQQGGTEVLVCELLRGLHPHFELVLVSADENRGSLPAPLERLISSHLSWDPARATAGSARALAAALRREKVQLAHFHFGGTFEWRSHRFWECPVYHVARMGIPCLSTNHLALGWASRGVGRPAWQRLLVQAGAALSRSLVYRQLKLEVCVSQQDRARVVGMFPWFGNKIIQRYHSLLPADAPPPELERRSPVVLCVGTVGGRKAQPNLVEAFAGIAGRHPAWRLELVGRVDAPEDAARIEACVARHQLGQRVHLLGRLSDEATVAWMKKASLFAIPSLDEGLGLSLQEALFHGCVAVGSRVGGIPELIEHEVNGLLVPPGDVSALSAALDRLMSDAGTREKLRLQSRPSILRKGMTAPAMVAGYRELYLRLLKPGFNHG